MTRDIFIWRKSIYENGFKCNECGAKLFNPKTGRPTDNLVVDADAKTEEEKSYCFCGKCQNVVAKWQEVSADEVDDSNILQGSYSEWIDKNAQDLSAEMQKRVQERIEKKYIQRIKDLENQLKGKDTTIKNLKLSYETVQKEKDEKIRKLYQELEHADNQIGRLQNEVKELLDEKLNGIRRIK